MWGDQPLALTRRQARALLYRIAAADQPVPREQLGYLLWPDSPEPAARRNLTVLLTQIRRALPRPDLLVTVDDVVGLDLTAAETDTSALAARIPQATSAGRLDLLADELRRYRWPIPRWLFALPNSVEFDTWTSQERQSLGAPLSRRAGRACRGLRRNRRVPAGDRRRAACAGDRRASRGYAPPPD